MSGADNDRAAGSTTDEDGRLVPEVQLRHALADLDNLRKRHARDAGAVRADERARVTAEWLPIVDDLSRALDHADDDPEAVVRGIRDIFDKAQHLLGHLGFPAFESSGEPFDASRHEAVAVVDHVAAQPGTVLETVRQGYGTSDRLLRPAGVVVARRPTG
jgi:molecular chaperone GrpE